MRRPFSSSTQSSSALDCAQTMQELAQRRRLLERPLPKINVGATPKMPKLNLGAASPRTPTATATSSECGSPRSSTAAASP